MPALTPRRLAIVGLTSAVAGAALNVVLVLAAGGGLSGGYIAGLLGGYVFMAVAAVIAFGALAALAQRQAGIALMLVPALFEIGFLIGSQISLWLLVIPSRN